MSHKCSVCQENISESVNQFSIKQYGKALCLKHQKDAATIKKYYCSDCKQEISRGEYKYSMDKFDKPLCRDCQPEDEETFSAPPKKFPGTYKVNT
jgi:hypothetical protein